MILNYHYLCHTAQFMCISAVLTCVCVTGCRLDSSSSAAKGVHVTSRVLLSKYVQLPIGVNGITGTRRYFPSLQVYDKDGRLVYVSNDAYNNSRFINDLPLQLSTLHPIPQARLLSDVAGEIPDLNSHIHPILANHSFTILAVSMDGCHACSTQESTLDASMNAIISRGINVISLQVAR